MKGTLSPQRPVQWEFDLFPPEETKDEKPILMQIRIWCRKCRERQPGSCRKCTNRTIEFDSLEECTRYILGPLFICNEAMVMKRRPPEKQRTQLGYHPVDFLIGDYAAAVQQWAGEVSA